MKIEKIEGAIIFTNKNFLTEIEIPSYFSSVTLTDFRINMVMKISGEEDLLKKLPIKLRKMANKLEIEVWRK